MSNQPKNYFSSKELCCNCGCGLNNFSPDLLLTLNSIRERVGRPVYLNSACRCKYHDLEIYLSGIKKSLDVGEITGFEYDDLIEIERAKERTSSHIKGFGADIRAVTAYDRYELKKEIYRLKVPRIGTGNTFIHIDIDISKKQNVEWLY